ncbi:MAG: hypothetical protein D6725_03370 [Planctomycetota bacterium]|nr:MAG: hypothetical protein D6725_03370 [Planctomycetota bacterium]
MDRGLCGLRAPDGPAPATPLRGRVFALAGIATAVLCLSCGGGCATLCGWLAEGPVYRYYARIPLDADKDRIVAALNDNIEPVQAWRCRGASIRVRQAGQPPVLLSAQIAVARPRRLRLVASLLGRDEVDIGSNDREFWCWIRRNDPPMVLTGLHDSPARAAAIPFEPEWLMQALGVLPLDPTEYRLEHSDEQRYVFLVDDRATLAGVPVYRVMTVDLFSGVIVAHTVYDRQGRVLLRARLTDFRTDERTGVPLPHRVALEWPPAGIAMSIGLREIEVNPTEIPESVWQRPPGGVR